MGKIITNLFVIAGVLFFTIGLPMIASKTKGEGDLRPGEDSNLFPNLTVNVPAGWEKDLVKSNQLFTIIVKKGAEVMAVPPSDPILEEVAQIDSTVSLLEANTANHWIVDDPVIFEKPEGKVVHILGHSQRKVSSNWLVFFVGGKQFAMSCEVPRELWPTISHEVEAIALSAKLTGSTANESDPLAPKAEQPEAAESATASPPANEPTSEIE